MRRKRITPAVLLALTLLLLAAGPAGSLRPQPETGPCDGSLSNCSDTLLTGAIESPVARQLDTGVALIDSVPAGDILLGQAPFVPRDILSWHDRSLAALNQHGDAISGDVFFDPMLQCIAPDGKSVLQCFMSDGKWQFDGTKAPALDIACSDCGDWTEPHVSSSPSIDPIPRPRFTLDNATDLALGFGSPLILAQTNRRGTAASGPPIDSAAQGSGVGPPLILARTNDPGTSMDTSQDTGMMNWTEGAAQGAPTVAASEPSTIGLLAVGLTLVGIVARKRNRRSHA